ncbi:MAG TPA: HlyD family type I secretion periplasmic adaptor subunit [Arenibaculum sp.]|nr:HlyD family type I secretion periplasmic adaptor subunit [Arenibaculum sp.]
MNGAAPHSTEPFARLPALSFDYETPAPVVRGARRFGIAVLVVFFAGFGGWAYLAPLNSAAIAHGVVSPEGHRRTVQHLEGGIIEAIHVGDGSIVERGQPLVTLQDVRTRSRLDAFTAELQTLRATEARLVAEQLDRDTIVFSDELHAAAADGPVVAGLIDLQQALFASRRAAREGQISILRMRIAQLREEIAGLEGQIASEDRQLDLIGEEIDGVRQLYDLGLERKPRLLALQRAMANVEGSRAANTARIARIRQAIGETELQIVTIGEQVRNETGSELAETRRRIDAIMPELLSAADQVDRTVIRAPVSGTVVELRYTTLNGVVPAGAPIMDIVPAEADLLIDARLSPLDVDTVREGLRAQVILPAFQQRNLPRLFGEVRYLSADTLSDQVTGQTFFLARIAVEADSLRELGPDVTLSAGMPAEVMIETGEQTLFQYLMRPFLDSVRRSFRES